jgi:AAA family ATP:ADP antiporter
MAEANAAEGSAKKPGSLDRFLRIFSDVRAGEGATAILASPGGAEIASYAAAGQAVLLMGFVPFYSWFSSKVDRRTLILSVGVFFFACVELFSFAAAIDLPYIGVIFYIWIGIFSLSTIAQFWAFANDLYTKEEGSRLFPVIGIGATAGSPIGAILVAKELYAAKLPTWLILQAAAALLALHVILSLVVHARESKRVTQKEKKQEPLSKKGGFSLVFKSRYLISMAVLFLVLNIVNSLGEYMFRSELTASVPAELDRLGLTALPDTSPEVKAAKDVYLGGFSASYQGITAIIAVIVQMLLVSRIVKIAGIRGIVLLLPLVSLMSYSVIAALGGLAVIRWAKTAENATDYSVMNTGRAMLWLPTSREEKYKAKQAIDTFFVRFGDVIAGGLVFLATKQLALTIRQISLVNIALVAVWIFVAVLVLREHQKLASEAEERTAA